MSDRIPPVLRPESPGPRPLTGLVAEFELRSVGALDGVDVTGVTLRSSEVQAGDLFVGIRGEVGHGASYAQAAAASGAVALLTDSEGAEIAAEFGLPILIVDSPRAALGAISAWLYRTNENPPLMLGITGTNGKTSTAYLLKGMLKQMGLVTGLSTTAERHIGDLTVVSRLTTPEASETHALLARMRESDVQVAVLEVSAQALTRHRVDGLFFDVVSFTNLSHDHLDDYADMDEYFAAKMVFFEPERGGRGVVCLDSVWGQRVVDSSKIPVTTVATTTASGAVNADWHVEILEETAEHTKFTLTGPKNRSMTTSIPIIGRHMAANAALAIVMMVEGGLDFAAIAEAVGERVDAFLPGRTERVSGNRGPTVYVDFGHSADAFLNTLEAVRRVTTGKVIMVVGADGDRDPSKRHEMGRVSSQYSDIVVITDHHPRFEDPASIRATMIEGVNLAEHRAELHEVSPPEKAIRAAVALAGENDSILWAGPGHQDYRDIRGVRTPYSARAEAREALSEAGWSSW